MSDIKFKHFNGDISTWQNNISSGTYDDDIVFGRVWDSIPDSSEYEMKLSIYAGKDNLGHDYIYDIPNFEQFEYLYNLLAIDSSNFTNELFRESLENYIKDSSALIQATLTQVDITSAKDVGYIGKGTVIPEGTSVEDLIKMIFTKVLGLQGATAPKVSLSGIPAVTMEVGDKITNVSVNASYYDGYWKNEEGWKNEHSGMSENQLYGCVALTYDFSGMGVSQVSAESSVVISEYTIVKGSNKVNCTTTYSESVNVPVNLNGQQLEKGTVNDTTHYKPQPASSATASTNTITGDYLYWIGYSSTIGSSLTREDIEDESKFTVVKTGFAGSSISYEQQFNTPQLNYVTIVVPGNMELKHVEDSFNNDVTNNYVKSEISAGIIGKDPTKAYNVYQEWAAAEAGIERKNIRVS